MAARRNFQYRASSALTATGNGNDLFVNPQDRNLRFDIDVTAVSGTTPTLAPKVQLWDATKGAYVDAGLAGSNITAAGHVVLLVGEEIVAAANLALNTVLTNRARLVYTVGGTTPSFTFSVTATLT